MFVVTMATRVGNFDERQWGISASAIVGIPQREVKLAMVGHQAHLYRMTAGTRQVECAKLDWFVSHVLLSVVIKYSGSGELSSVWFAEGLDHPATES
jgi:hypothetical protein